MPCSRLSPAWLFPSTPRPPLQLPEDEAKELLAYQLSAAARSKEATRAPWFREGGAKPVVAVREVSWVRVSERAEQMWPCMLTAVCMCGSPTGPPPLCRARRQGPARSSADENKTDD